MNTEETDHYDKRPYHHGDLRNACITAALELLHVLGINGVTLRSVAEKAGVSHSAPYRHFATKRDLLAACAARGFRMLEYEVTKAASSSGDNPVEQLINGSFAYARFASDHPHHYRLMFGDELADAEYPEIAEAGKLAFGVPILFFEAAQKAGIVRKSDPRIQAFALWSALHGVVNFHIDSRSTQIADASAIDGNLRSILSILLEGLVVQQCPSCTPRIP